MCALAVLQVAVGSILTIETSYGGMLVGFMFVSIWTLSLMSLYEAYLQYEAGGPGDFAVRPVTVARSTGGWRMGRKAAAEQARSLWMRPTRRGGRSSSILMSGGWGSATRCRCWRLGMAALVVAAAFFLFIPRLWAGRTEWGKNEHKSDAIGMTGFSNEVRLGDIVPLLENSKRVLQVRLFNSNGDPLDVEEYCAQAGYAEPLFRGTTLEKYEESTWKGNGHLSSAETKSRRRPPVPSASRS